MVNARRRPVIRAALIASFQAQKEAIESALTQPPWEPLPHQTAPEGDWEKWLMLAGRGSGKTDAGAYYMNAHALGPPCDPRVPGGHRMGIVAPTLGDAAASCVEGVSGLKAHNPQVRMVGRIGGQFVIWPNGARARLFSAENKRTVDRLRAGGNRCLDWWEELAAWPELKEGIDQAEFGLRMGARPRAVATTTPKPRKPLQDLIDDADVKVTHATTDDNPHLPEKRRRALYKRYGDTEKGKQELGGRMMAEAEGALWKREWLDKWRLPVCDACLLVPPPQAKHNHPDFQIVVIAVDPSGGDDEDNDEQGIGAAALGRDGRVYILEDATTKQDPTGWGDVVVQTYKRWHADHVAAETNYGGAMVLFVIRTTDPRVPVKVLTASRGKAIRAEPVANLFKNGYVSLIGSFPDLEDELCVAAGTLVITERGEIPIEQVRTGDRAMTRVGWRDIKWAGQTGIQNVIRITLDTGEVLDATGNHPVNVSGRGWTKVRDLREGDKIQRCIQWTPESDGLLSSTTVSATSCGQTVITRRAAVEAIACSIGTCGEMRTARSPKARTSIMRSPSTSTIRSISKRSHQQSMSQSMNHAASLPGDLKSTAGRFGERGRNENQLNESVSSVVENSSPTDCEQRSAAVAVHVGTVRSLQALPARVPVFNLSIPDQPEFFANRILVHNCQWTPHDDRSPNRLDWLVWAVTDLYGLDRMDEGDEYLQLDDRYEISPV